MKKIIGLVLFAGTLAFAQGPTQGDVGRPANVKPANLLIQGAAMLLPITLPEGCFRTSDGHVLCVCE